MEEAMEHVYSCEQIRSIEAQWALQNGGSTWPLMQRAAQAFVDAYYVAFIAKKVTVVAGSGNNGGDAYYIAWLLKQRAIDVQVYAPFGAPKSNSDAAKAHQLFLELSSHALSDWPAHSDILIDGLYGIGLNRPLDAETIELIEKMNNSRAEIYSIDIPSGLNAETGLPMPVAVNAKATLAMIGYKPGLLTADGPSYSGCIGVDSLAIQANSSYKYITDWPTLADKSGNGHKGLFGVVTVLGGNQEMAGAAILAGHAALKSGAGKVMVHCDPNFHRSAISLAPELMVKGLGKTPLMTGDNHAIVVGPGIGRNKLATRVVNEAILSAPLYGGVVDADGLRILAAHPKPMNGWVLTPHAGEAAALLATTSQLIQADRVTAVREIAKKYQCVVVLKGAGTLVSNGQEVVFCHPGHGAMATPGMGDVLAGIVGTLLSQGCDPLNAAVSAVNWHARIGVYLARTQHSVFASDVIRCLPLKSLN
jgi:NAD(P)H-hydrate epimerase